MSGIFDTAQDDKSLALAGLLLGMGQGFSQAGAQGGSFLSGLGNAGGAGFRNMLGFQQMAGQDALRKFQLQKMQREMEREDAIRRGMTEGDAPQQTAAVGGGTPVPIVPVERGELPLGFAAPAEAAFTAPTAQGPTPPTVPQGPVPGQQSPTAPQPRPPGAVLQADADVPPLLRGLPPEVAAQVRRVARADPQGAYKMLVDFTGEMLKAGRWEMVPHPQDPNTLISVDKYGMRPPVAVPHAFAREFMLRRAGATNVNMRVDQAGGVKLAELGAKAIGELNDRMPIVQAQLGSLDLMEKALDAYKTGFAGDAGLKLRQALEAIGVKTNASAGEFFNSLATASQLSSVPPGQGAVSNFERELYAKAAPSLDKTPEGNRLLIQAKRSMLEREREAATILQEEVEANRDNLGTAFLNYGRRLQRLGPTLSPAIASQLQRATGGAPTATDAPTATQPRTRIRLDAEGNIIR